MASTICESQENLGHSSSVCTRHWYSIPNSIHIHITCNNKKHGPPISITLPSPSSLSYFKYPLKMQPYTLPAKKKKKKTLRDPCTLSSNLGRIESGSSQTWTWRRRGGCHIVRGKAWWRWHCAPPPGSSIWPLWWPGMSWASLVGTARRVSHAGPTQHNADLGKRSVYNGLEWCCISEHLNCKG